MKNKKTKHQHRWEYTGESCAGCGYTERWCKNCTVVQSSMGDDKEWKTISE